MLNFGLGVDFPKIMRDWFCLACTTNITLVESTFI